MADRQDATISFVEKRSLIAVQEIARLPGVLAVKPYREVPVRIRCEGRERRVMISDRPRAVASGFVVRTVSTAPFGAIFRATA
jgi:putative ABC transport system permease protein